MRRLTAVAGMAAISLGVGTAIAALPGGASAVRAAHHRPEAADATPAARETHPPTPRVSTLGVTRSATLVSYCWTHKLPAGGSQGVCADGTLVHPAHTLRWEPGARVRVDLGLAAHDVEIQAVRLEAAGGRHSLSHIIRLRIAGIDASGRRWKLRLPRRAKTDTELLISARFANGDVEADLGLRRG